MLVYRRRNKTTGTAQQTAEKKAKKKRNRIKINIKMQIIIGCLLADLGTNNYGAVSHATMRNCENDLIANNVLMATTFNGLFFFAFFLSFFKCIRMVCHGRGLDIYWRTNLGSKELVCVHLHNIEQGIQSTWFYNFCARFHGYLLFHGHLIQKQSCWSILIYLL